MTDDAVGRGSNSLFSRSLCEDWDMASSRAASVDQEEKEEKRRFNLIMPRTAAAIAIKTFLQLITGHRTSSESYRCGMTTFCSASSYPLSARSTLRAKPLVRQFPCRLRFFQDVSTARALLDSLSTPNSAALRACTLSLPAPSCIGEATLLL